jgi:hypothetical protein
VDEESIAREELTATLFAINDLRDDVREIRGCSRRTTMAKPRKMTPEELAERERRSQEFRQLLEKRKQRDAEFAAARKRQAG